MTDWIGVDMGNRTCSMDGCERPHLARGFCGAHYTRWSKHGDPNFMLINRGNTKPRPVITERTCIDCGHHGPIEEFTPRRNVCRDCHRERGRRWKDSNPAKVEQGRIRNAAKAREREEVRKATRKGLDPELVAAYREGHSGTCDICGCVPSGRRPWLYVDHDHESGAFRGLLCGHCNLGLGHFADDTDRMLTAIKYLTEPPALSPGDLLELLQHEKVTA